MTWKEMWDKLLGIGVSNEVIKVVTSLYGIKEETFDNILWYYTGYNSIKDFDEERDLY